MHKYFGGSKENAYILMYRKTNLNHKNGPLKNMKPPYMILDKVLIENQECEKMVSYYETMKYNLSFNVTHIDNMGDMVNYLLTEEVNHISPAYPKTRVVVGFQDSLDTLRVNVREVMHMESDDFLLISYEKQENGTYEFCQLVSENKLSGKFVLMKDIKIFHNADFVLVPYDHPNLLSFSNKI